MISASIPDDLITDTLGLCRLVGASERAIAREIRHGRLRAHLRLGRRWYTGQDIRAWLTSQVYCPADPDHQDEVEGIATA